MRRFHGIVKSGYGVATTNLMPVLRLVESRMGWPKARAASKVPNLLTRKYSEGYGLLFRTSAETLLEVARNPRHLGAEIGFFSVLHTWSQKLKIHPHVHCVVPAGGLSPDHTRWVRSPDNYFLPKAVLREVFRGKFVDALEQAFQSGHLQPSPGLLCRWPSHLALA